MVLKLFRILLEQYKPLQMCLAAWKLFQNNPVYKSIYQKRYGFENKNMND